MYVVILAGGMGSRLWPCSRQDHPKHLLSLSGNGHSILQETWERVAPLAQAVYLVTQETQVKLIQQQLPELDPAQIIVEPQARGTTNALGLAAFTLLEWDPEAVLVTAASDQIIRGQKAYAEAIKTAEEVAREFRQLVVIGLKPNYPATSFGYIQVEGGDPAETVCQVERFVEKPDLATAVQFVNGGQHFWNLGMLCARCDVLIEALRKYGEEHYCGLKAVVEARAKGDLARATQLYSELPNQAIDYTVLEKAESLRMVPAGFEWADVGSWSELAEQSPTDSEGNFVEGEAVFIDVKNSFVKSAPKKAVAMIGVEDLIVVDTPDALLICPKSRSQEVKEIVSRLNRQQLNGYL